MTSEDRNLSIIVFEVSSNWGSDLGGLNKYSMTNEP